MKALRTIFLIVFLFVISLFFVIYSQSHELKLHKVTDNLYMVSGAVCNVAFFVTEDGVLVVDSGAAPPLGKTIITKIGEITNKPVKYLIYTHYHHDHVNGSESFPQTAKVISHVNTLNNMKKFTLSNLVEDLEKKVEKLKAENSPKLKETEEELTQIRKAMEETKNIKPRLPESTFNEKLNLELGGKKVKLLYMGNAHTNGDTIVYFPSEKTIHMGDLLFNKMIPYIDYAAGSNTKNWLNIIDKVSEMDIENVIPGHGELTDKKGLLAQSQYLNDIRTEVKKCIDQGVSLAEAKEKVKLPKYENYGFYGNFFQVNVDAIYKEMTEEKEF